MKSITYRISHVYQPTNNSCAQSALSMLLSYYGVNLTPQQIMAEVPVMKNDLGEDCGTINQNLATWCLGQGFKVVMYTADFQVIDLSWARLEKAELLNRLALVQDYRLVPSLGPVMSKLYVRSYIDFLTAGGDLYIRPFMTTELLNNLLASGPILACVCYQVFYNTGRSKDIALRASELDDLHGRLTTHSVVIYGRNNEDNYLIADPWREPGREVVDRERLLCSMTAAQLECDNIIIQLSRP
jgi:hypothetical protein